MPDRKNAFRNGFLTLSLLTNTPTKKLTKRLPNPPTYSSKIVTDTVMLVCQLLRQDLRELQELVDTMEPVKSWDEG